MSWPGGICGPQRRHWWDLDPVTFRFSNPRVRFRLIRLMRTDKATLTDKQFMVELNMMIHKCDKENVLKNVRLLRMAALDSLKQLALTGEISMEAPLVYRSFKELFFEHPVFRIARLTKKIGDEIKLKHMRKAVPPKWAKPVNYDTIERRFTTNMFEERDMIDCIDLELSQAERERKVQDIADYITHGMANYTEYDYRRIKYEDPQLEYLRNAEGVEELYEMADEYKY